MPSPPTPAGRVSWTAAVALAALAAGLALAWWMSRPAPAPHPGPAALAPDPAAEAPAAPDSTEIKRRWVDEVRGVDVSDLDPARRELFLRHANSAGCSCGCGYTLAGCRASDMTCDVSGGRLAALLDSIRAGHVRDARGIRERPRDGG